MLLVIPSFNTLESLKTFMQMTRGSNTVNKSVDNEINKSITDHNDSIF